VSGTKQRAGWQNTCVGLVTDSLEQSWWPQQVKVDARLGFVPSALTQTSSQYLEVHQYRVRGDSWWHNQHASAFGCVHLQTLKDLMR